MTASGYTYIVSTTGSGIGGWTTDCQAVEAIFGRLGKLFPQAVLSVSRFDWDSTSSAVSFKAKKLELKDPQVAAWMVEQLCSQGWEVFESSGYGLGFAGATFHLRLRG